MGSSGHGLEVGPRYSGLLALLGHWPLEVEQGRQNRQLLSLYEHPQPLCRNLVSFLDLQCH